MDLNACSRRRYRCHCRGEFSEMKNPTMTFADYYLPYHPERKCFIDFNRLSVEDYNNKKETRGEGWIRVSISIATIHSPPNQMFGYKIGCRRMIE